MADRQNVWVRGAYPTYPVTGHGVRVTAANPRRESTASNTSTTSNNSNASPKPNNENNGSKQTIAERRSSGTASPRLFQNLFDQKRGSTDSVMAGRRLSYNEQSPKGGFVSRMWERYTKY